jgi:hypothetical protein
MKKIVIAVLAVTALTAGAPSAYAKGCLKGAAVGAVAGHVAHHHAVLGAVAGCIIGHHLAVKKEQEHKAQHAQQSHAQVDPAHH